MAARDQIGRRIRQAREELGMSQTDLGRRLSRPRSHAAISDLERGNVRVDAEELTEIARVLNKDLPFFYGAGPQPGIVYRRGDYGLSEEQQRETDLSVEAFRRFARNHVRREGSDKS